MPHSGCATIQSEVHMERTVPKSASDEIDLYLRTIYSLLRSTTEVQIRTLEEVHSGMNSSLHLDARKESPDISAFIYAILRLPACISEVRSIVLRAIRMLKIGIKFLPKPGAGQSTLMARIPWLYLFPAVQILKMWFRY
jgi:hypothetical protein